jgi:SAM-dependent methyltransferase
MAGERLDTRAIGLDVGLAFARWLTGAENLHYGLWTGLEVSAANLRAAQEAYTARLFSLLPGGSGLRILDVGGGAGETAAKLIAMGHHVQIVVPSAYLAGRCRENAPLAQVHECLFQDFQGTGPFDVCLFSESFQYIPLDQALGRAKALLAPAGRIVIGDCFRAPSFRAGGPTRAVGGGHPIASYRVALAVHGLAVLSEEDVTEGVAPSIDLEQGFFNVIGHGLRRIDHELTLRRPWQARALHLALRLLVGSRARTRIGRRLFHADRTSAAFVRNNRYILTALAPAPSARPA